MQSAVAKPATRSGQVHQSDFHLLVLQSLFRRVMQDRA
jgi:hypothetical protein